MPQDKPPVVPDIPGRWAALSSFFLVLSFPLFDVGWLAWIALVPWLLTLDRMSERQAILWSYLQGVFFFGCTVWWVGCVTVPGLIVLVAYLALFFAAWGWAAKKLMKTGGWRFFAGVPAVWVLLEFSRSSLLTGLGWNFLAHTQWEWLPVIQIAEFTGVYGVSFLIVLVNGAGFLLLRSMMEAGRGGHGEGQGARGTGQENNLKTALMFLGIALGVLAAAAGYGYLRLNRIEASLAPRLASHTPRPVPHAPVFKVAVVQGNIPQPEKWDDAFQEAIWKRFGELTSQSIKDNPDLVIWPETSVPDYLDNEEVAERIKGVARQAGSALLVGAPAGELESSRIFNAAVFFDREGVFLGRYDKVHLVPFGEYLPLERILGWMRKFVLMGGFSHGKDFTVFRHPIGSEGSNHIPPFSVLVCFEDLFPGLTRKFSREGAQWLVVITNDAWFGRSGAAIQHLQASVFRAVEQRMWVVRAANTGFSGFVSPSGRVLPKPHQVPLYRSGIASATISVSSEPSFYSAHADWFQILAVILAGSAFLPTRKRVR